MEPWIGWIRLADGQRQTGAHPGSAWLTPPLRPAPGRESERFAMVLDLAGPAPSRLYREIRDAAAQAFWSTPGSPIAALRRAVIAAHRALVRFNRQVPPESRCVGNLACAALRADEIFLAHAGVAWSRAVSADGGEQHPDHPPPPLGSQPYAEMAIAYIPVRPGMTLLLATQNLLNLVTPDALDQVLRREGEDILDGLEQLAGDEPLTAIILHWPTEEPAPLPPQPSPRRRAVPPPPEKVPAPPPRIPEEEKVPEPVVTPEEPAFWEGIGRVETETAEPEAWPPEIAFPSPVPQEEPRPGRKVLGGLATIGRGLAAGAAAIGGGLVRGASAVGRSLGAAVSAAYRGTRTLSRRALPGAERRRVVSVRAPRPVPQENPRRMAALAIVILILVILATLIAWFRYGPDLRRGQVLSQAQAHMLAAQQATHPELARPHWEAILTLTADYDDPEARALRTMAQDALDQMDGVIRVAPTLLADVGDRVSRNRLVAWEQSVAVLEGQVRRVLMGGGSEVLSLPGSPVLIDIARSQPGPGQPSSALLILGAGGLLWAYDSRWSEARPMALSAVPGGHDPVAMATYGGRLYLLDPAGGQIWRYLPENGEFAKEPEPYFLETPSLSGARDMALNYSIYVLFEDGAVARYEEGKAAPFAVSGIPAPEARFVALAVDPNVENGPVYLADEASDRIVVLRDTGVFCAQLRPSGDEFRGLQALTVSEAGDALFVLAGGRIYRVTIPPLPCR